MLKRALIISTTSELSIEPPPSLKVSFSPLWILRRCLKPIKDIENPFYFILRSLKAEIGNFVKWRNRTKKCFYFELVRAITYSWKSIVPLPSLSNTRNIVSANCSASSPSATLAFREITGDNEGIAQYKPCSAWQIALWSSLLLDTRHWMSCSSSWCCHDFDQSWPSRSWPIPNWKLTQRTYPNYLLFPQVLHFSSFPSYLSYWRWQLPLSCDSWFSQTCLLRPGIDSTNGNKTDQMSILSGTWFDRILPELDWQICFYDCFILAPWRQSIIVKTPP